MSDDERGRDDQNGSVRPGAEAAGGVMPQPDDPLTPRKVAAATSALEEELKDGGFGDDKGGRI